MFPILLSALVSNTLKAILRIIRLRKFIGQKYHAVLDAVPIGLGAPSSNGNYWIRTIPADGCKGFETGNEPGGRQGIPRYDASSTDVPATFRDGFSKACRDGNYDRLTPILPWSVAPVEFSRKFQHCQRLFHTGQNCDPTDDTEQNQKTFNLGKDYWPGRLAATDNFFW
jgi:hypothetical protein